MASSASLSATYNRDTMLQEPLKIRLDEVYLLVPDLSDVDLELTELPLDGVEVWRIGW
jgi:hypothetical protein